MTFVQVLKYLLAFFPTWFIVVVIGFLAIFTIIIVLKLIAIVLDAIPFL